MWLPNGWWDFFLKCYKIYSYFWFVFSAENIESDVATLKIFTAIQKWYRRGKWIFLSFLIGPCCFPAGSNKKISKFPRENIKVFEVALVAVRCNCQTSCIMTVWGCQPWNTTSIKTNISCLSKVAIKRLKQNVKSVQNY